MLILSGPQGTVVGYIFNDEAQALFDELMNMRNCLGPGEFFCKADAVRHDELSRRLRELMGRDR